MAFDPATELAAAQEAYLTNAPPFRNTVQVSAFINAAAKLLMLTPESSGSREGNVTFSIDAIRRERENAEKWLQANGGGGATGTSANGNQRTRVIRASLRNFRD